MRLIPSLLGSTLVLAGAASSQTYNQHVYFTDSAWNGVNAATRVGGSTTGDVECLVDFAALTARGIGAASKTSCAVTGQTYVLQDQDRLTQDNYKIVYRKPTAADGPADTTANGIVAITANIQVPVPPASTSGAIAWNMTMTWVTPVAIPCETGLYAGLELLPGATASDFVYMQSANTFTVGSPNTGDNPRGATPKFYAARVDWPAGTFVRTTSQRTLAFNLLTSTPTMNVGNVDGSQANYKSYGLGGTYPAVKMAPRDDGIALRVQDESSLGGLGALIVSVGYLPGGIDLPGIGGTIWLNPGPIVSLGGIALPSASPGVVETVVAPPGVIPAAPGTMLVFQAATANATLTTVRLSNAQATVL